MDISSRSERWSLKSLPQRPSIDALTQHVAYSMPDQQRVRRIGYTAHRRVGQPELAIRLAQQHHTIPTGDTAAAQAAVYKMALALRCCDGSSHPMTTRLQEGLATD